MSCRYVQRKGNYFFAFSFHKSPVLLLLMPDPHFLFGSRLFLFLIFLFLFFSLYFWQEIFLAHKTDSPKYKKIKIKIQLPAAYTASKCYSDIFRKKIQKIETKHITINPIFIAIGQCVEHLFKLSKFCVKTTKNLYHNIISPT